MSAVELSAVPAEIIAFSGQLCQLGNYILGESSSILLISEEMPELIGMSDRILVMKDGKITKELQRSPELTDAVMIQYMI